MQIETTKGNFDGTFEECAAWLEDMQPSHADLVIGHLTESINPDDDNCARSLRVACVGLGEQAAADDVANVALAPDPEDDVIGSGEWSHAELAGQLEMRGYIIVMDHEDNEHSWVTHPATGDDFLADIYGDSVATVKNCF